jgi:arabinose-5-phosphate isomerase
LTLESANIIKKYAILAIQNELNSLKSLESYIDDSFANAVVHILDSPGRVVITGIGKSAIIAQKIVATMNSTGQPAIFMHAADAVHGDLGIIQKDDTVIAISKSGNTPEIKLLAPLLRSFGNKLIAMVGNTESELAKLADFVLNTTIDMEACPNNLAPTTSTTAQMLMGDALAVSLLQMRNFTGKDFSRYHPGGSLGKRLYLRCGELAAKNEKPMVDKDASVKDAIIEISRKRLGAAVVCDADNHVLGIITDGDIRRMLEKYDTFANLKVMDIMNTNPTYIDANSLATDAAAEMMERKISQIIITDHHKYAGLVHIHDLNREGIL